MNTLIINAKQRNFSSSRFLATLAVALMTSPAVFAQNNNSGYGPSGLERPRFINSADQRSPTPIDAAEPTRNPASPRGEILAQTAQISCIHKIQMAAQADGLIKELLVDEGSVVSKGDPILIIDSRVATAELGVAEKQLESASIIAAQTANIEFAEAARDLAIEEYKSERELYKKRSTTESALKRKHLEMRKTMFSVDMANDEQRKYQLEAAIAEEQVNASKVKLELYQVLAPYDGIIVERKRDLGEWIRAGEPVVRLVHMSEMELEAFVLLDELSPQSLEGADMNIVVPNAYMVDGQLYNFEKDAKVGFVSPELDARTVRVTARIKNEQVGGLWILRDGMKAIVKIYPVR